MKDLIPWLTTQLVIWITTGLQIIKNTRWDQTLPIVMIQIPGLFPGSRFFWKDKI
jgi:hypothetical protein